MQSVVFLSQLGPTASGIKVVPGVNTVIGSGYFSLNGVVSMKKCYVSVFEA